jgi:hypothetical protein
VKMKRGLCVSRVFMSITFNIPQKKKILKSLNRELKLVYFIEESYGN